MKLTELVKLKKFKAMALIFVLSISLILLLTNDTDDTGKIRVFIPTILFALNIDTAVGIDSDVDAVANIGTNDSSFTNAATKNGIHQNITEVSAPELPPMMFSKVGRINQLTELFNERSQTGRHFYNSTSDTYTFRTDNLVFKQGEVADTDWVTFNEFPIRFIVRLKNGSNYKFQYSNDLDIFFSQIDNDTLWGLAIETFNGMMGFYMDLTDTTWGHGQYLYYPRLKDGRLPNFNQPQYGIYPHLFVKAAGSWFDNLLNNRTFYSGSNDPRDHFTFFNTSDTIGLQFKTDLVAIDGFDWNFTQGIKYNTTDQSFHMITDFVSVDRGWQDIGMSYDVTVSPQAIGTSYEPELFILRNVTDSKTINITNIWKANESITQPLNEIVIVSENKESFKIDFEDMKLVGFNKTYLELHNQILPNNIARKSLLFGMYDYGPYTQGTLIEIDPTFSETAALDERDFFAENNTEDDTYSVHVTSNEIKSAWDEPDNNRTGFLSWDLGISDQIMSVSNVNLTLTVAGTTRLEADEYIELGFYYNETLENGFWNETYADGAAATDDWAYLQTLDYSDVDGWRFDGVVNDSTMVNASNMLTLLDNWKDLHNTDPTGITFLNMVFRCGLNCDVDPIIPDDDKIDFYESTYDLEAFRPVLTFDYNLPQDTSRLEWEHQVFNVDTFSADNTYTVTIFGQSSDAEEFEIQMWNRSSTDWETALSTNINSTLTWFNNTLSCSSFICGDNMTYRFVDVNSSAGDAVLTNLSIDYSGVHVFSQTLNLTQATISVNALPDAVDTAFNENALNISVDSGIDYDIQIRGTDTLGTPVASGLIFFDTDDNPAGYTVLTTTYQTLYNDQLAATTDLQFWLWANIPSGELPRTDTFTLFVRITPA